MSFSVFVCLFSSPDESPDALTNLSAFSGRAVWYQTHLSPFCLSVLSEAREDGQGEVYLL